MMQKGVDWMNLAQCKNQSLTLVYTITHLPSESIKGGECLEWLSNCQLEGVVMSVTSK